MSAVDVAVKVAYPHDLARAALRKEAQLIPRIGSRHILPVLRSGALRQSDTPQEWVALLSESVYGRRNTEHPYCERLAFCRIGRQGAQGSCSWLD